MMRYDSKVTGTSGYNDHDNIQYFPKHGYSTYQNICRPQISTTFSNVDRYYDFRLPFALAVGSSAGQQEFDGNDTITQFQRFRNYYAFDDGSPEAGYYILGAGRKNGWRLIWIIPIRCSEWIFILRMWVRSQDRHLNFRWAAQSNGVPGTLLYQQTDSVHYIKTGYKDLPHYAFSTPKVLLQKARIFRFQQLDALGISVGYDRNFDGKSVYFDSGSGWQQSQFHGSVMIHRF